MKITRSGLPISLAPTFVNEPEKGLPEIRIPDDPNFDEILHNVRILEGALSLWGVSQISEDDCLVSWLAESPEEESQIAISSFSMSYAEREADLPFPADMLVRSVLCASRFSAFEVPLNFFRRGKNDLAGRRYIDAIGEFYFMLETLFANGRFRQREVINEMLSSSELRRAVESTLDSVKRDVLSAHYDVAEEMERSYISQSSDKILERIVELRGFLHHHTMKRKDIWHPAEQKRFRADAIFLSALCNSIASRLVVNELFEEGAIELFRKTVVTATNGDLVKWRPLEE